MLLVKLQLVYYYFTKLLDEFTRVFSQNGPNDLGPNINMRGFSSPNPEIAQFSKFFYLLIVAIAIYAYFSVKEPSIQIKHKTMSESE